MDPEWIRSFSQRYGSLNLLCHFLRFEFSCGLSGKPRPKSPSPERGRRGIFSSPGWTRENSSLHAIGSHIRLARKGLRLKFRVFLRISRDEISWNFRGCCIEKSNLAWLICLSICPSWFSLFDFSDVHWQNFAQYRPAKLFQQVRDFSFFCEFFEASLLGTSQGCGRLLHRKIKFGT